MGRQKGEGDSTHAYHLLPQVEVGIRHHWAYSVPAGGKPRTPGGRMIVRPSSEDKPSLKVFSSGPQAMTRNRRMDRPDCISFDFQPKEKAMKSKKSQYSIDD